ncbi:hypothetical protein EAG_03213 [Camponotus floridanus]|uniref:Uncharacterized protein n=1 Tax=Camponotus floridanus TaxID=104421 RepID=E2B235_CAMFO|nr:hypothetical protein EAG_03213 [Camponotus floridanus]
MVNVVFGRDIALMTVCFEKLLRDREESVENIRHLQIAQVQLQCGYHGISDGWRGLNEKVEVMEGRVGWDGRSWAFVRTPFDLLSFRVQRDPSSLYLDDRMSINKKSRLIRGRVAHLRLVTEKQVFEFKSIAKKYAYYIIPRLRPRDKFIDVRSYLARDLREEEQNCVGRSAYYHRPNWISYLNFDSCSNVLKIGLWHQSLAISNEISNIGNEQYHMENHKRVYPFTCSKVRAAISQKGARCDQQN